MTTPTFQATWPAIRGVLAALLPLLVLLTVACGRKEGRSETRNLEPYALSVETPAGWTGGGAGGTYEFHSPDGDSRVRVARIDGVTSLTGLRDAQLLQGTGASPVSNVIKTTPTKIGALAAVRARISASDHREYDVVAVQTAGGVVLFQTSVAQEKAGAAEDDVERLFSGIRQSIKPLE